MIVRWINNQDLKVTNELVNKTLIDYLLESLTREGPQYGVSGLPNWLEDLILHQQGPDVYDLWSNQELLSGSDEITLSILEIGKLIFIEDAVFGGNKRMVRKEFP